MVLAVLLLITGLLLLYYGAESLITGSSRLALSFGIPPLIIGMTIVAFATSMPEFMVSLLAVLKGSSDIAAGNILGSNIANIGLILGSAALASPMVIASSLLAREIPFMLAASGLLYLLALDGILGFGNGLVLVFLLGVFLFYCLRQARVKDLEKNLSEDVIEREKPGRKKDVALVLVGMVGVGFGAELMVRSAVTIGRGLGVSELVIGVSVVALGTSLPELAASMMSAWKGEMDISIGNVIGSNIFNLLFVLGICPMLHPLTIEPSALKVEFPIMLAFSGGLWLLLFPQRALTRWKGGLLLASYLGFLLFLFV